MAADRADIVHAVLLSCLNFVSASHLSFGIWLLQPLSHLPAVFSYLRITPTAIVGMVTLPIVLNIWKRAFIRRSIKEAETLAAASEVEIGVMKIAFNEMESVVLGFILFFFDILCICNGFALQSLALNCVFFIGRRNFMRFKNKGVSTTQGVNIASLA